MAKATDFILKDTYTLDELIDLISFLRSADGCPWDRIQTPETIKKNLVEEAYETIDAINSGEPQRIADELGDVLMQVVFQADMAKDQGHFDFQQVVSGICRKLISRHTHVFGRDTADEPDAVLETWEANKKREKGLRSQSDVLKDVPHSLPALQRAAKVQHKASQVGFDWQDAAGPRAKILEELAELEQEAATAFCPQGQPLSDTARRRLESEAGDLLFAVVNYLRFLKVEPELALNLASDKFIRRFSKVEQRITQAGQSMEDLSLAALDAVWDQVKEDERASRHQGAKAPQEQ